MKILLVEDSTPGGEVTQAFLCAHGYEVKLASNGEQALLLRETWHPDVVLLDLNLPDMRPLDLLNEIRNITARQRGPRVPVILTTGVLPDEATRVKVEAERRGLGPIPAVLCKPFEPEALLDLLDQFPG